MQALVAPLAAAAGGTATLTAALPAIGAVAGGLADRAEGKAVAEQNRINAYIGKTRAIQTDAQARDNMGSELASLRAAFAANGQRPTVGTEAIFNEMRRVRGRERRVEFGNRMQEASSYSMAAKSAQNRGRLGMIGGIIKAAPSIFDVYEMRKRSA